MANGVMNRPMFAGAMPAPSSVGTGITSGLVDPAVEQATAEQGFAQLAGMTQNTIEKLDTAETVDEAMNAIRGDQATEKERRQELASYVGKTDANKTPTSVLAMLQPTFTIMDMIQNNAPEGGIANAMPQAGGGQPAGNFSQASAVQAPGMEEAMMRMMAGEQPVRRQVGSSPYGEVIPKIPQINVNPRPAVPTLNLPYVETNTRPSLQSIDMGNVSGYANEYMQLMKPYLESAQFGAGPSTTEALDQLSPYMPKTQTPEDLIARNRGLLEQYLPQKRTSAELLKEYQDMLGAGDDDQAQLQAYLALAQAGQAVAQSDKNLLGAAIEGGGVLSEKLAPIAAAKAQQDRQLKLAALAESKEQARARDAAEANIVTGAISQSDQMAQAFQGAQLNVALDAINRSVNANSKATDAVLGAASDAIKNGITLDANRADVLNKEVLAQWNANNQYGTTATESWGKYNPETKSWDIIGVRRTADGLKMVDPDGGSFKPIPEGYSLWTKDIAEAKGGTSAVDLSKAKREDILIPDPASPSGYSQVPGFFTGGIYFVSPDGNPANAQVAPAGFIRGNEKDVLTVAQPDGVGRVFVTVKTGPKAGQTFLSSVAGKPVVGAAYALEAPVRDDAGALVSGNPMVYTVPNPGVGFANMTSQQVEQAQRKVMDMTQAITAANEILPNIGDAIGPLNTVKAWTSNVVGAVAPDSWAGLTEYAATERGRQQMNLFARNLSRALALSDRYAVAEQQLIREMAENPEGFWKNPNMSEVKFQEMMRVLQNELSFNRGLLSDSDEIPQLNAIPTGSVNDPFMYGAPGQFEYLTITMANAGNRDALNGRVIRMTASEAQRNGIPQNLWKGKDFVDLEIGKDINIR